MRARSCRAGVPCLSLVRAGCSAGLLWLSACGGAGDSAPAPAPRPGPAPQSAGLTQAVDRSTNGDPAGLRVARSANGDGFVVWRAGDGTRNRLWASRYLAAAPGWGEPVEIDAGSADVTDDFHLSVDARGNAMVVWTQVDTGIALQVMSARFDAGTGTWATPVGLGAVDAGRPVQVAGDGSGAVHVFDEASRDQAFDPGRGTWQLAPIPMAIVATGFVHDPVPVLDGHGNALAVFLYSRSGLNVLGSNYYSAGTGRWDELPPVPSGDFVMGLVPGSLVEGALVKTELAAAGEGHFLAAWQGDFGEDLGLTAISVARFASPTRTWTRAQTLVPQGPPEAGIRLQRLGSDAAGNALMLWTENDATRTLLKSLRLDAAGVPCDAVKTLDRAIGGGAAQVDLAVDRQGAAIAVWQQSEGGHPGDGSRSNIALSRFARDTGAWRPATLAESQPGDAFGPQVSASAGQALLGWIQAEGAVRRVNVMLLALD